jgi:hypothetical protein
VSGGSKAVRNTKERSLFGKIVSNQPWEGT